jgi:hypothetical protein
MTLALGWFLEFQGPEESRHLKHNMYKKYKTYNTFCIKNYIMLIFRQHCCSCLQDSNKGQRDP